MNKFIFIIPRTPIKYRNTTRDKLWKTCINALLKQTYKNWEAIIIGKDINLNSVEDNRFIELNYEGHKGEKMQKATEYIIKNNISGDYLLRLDDDDIINPKILERLSKLSFDLYVDKYQWFWHYESGKISNRVWTWFPNTCIHNRKHALTQWGEYAKANFEKFKDHALLIENDHSQINSYYKNKKVIFAPKKYPVYLRTITSTSITAQKANNAELYYKKFGRWKTNNLNDFVFLSNFSPKLKVKPSSLNISEYIKILREDFSNKKKLKSSK